MGPGKLPFLVCATCDRRISTFSSVARQDTFQAPPLMVFFPQIARNLLQNRMWQLPSYRINAKAFGLQGAWVPVSPALVSAERNGFWNGVSKHDPLDHSGRSVPPAASRGTTTLRTKRSTSPATSRSSSSSTTRFARTAPSSETFSRCYQGSPTSSSPE